MTEDEFIKYLNDACPPKKQSSSIKKKNKKISKKYLLNIIAELNRNLKQNTNILVQMKESLSNLSLYHDASAFENDMKAIEEYDEKLNESTDDCIAHSSSTDSLKKTNLVKQDSEDLCVRPEMVSQLSLLFIVLIRVPERD